LSSKACYFAKYFYFIFDHVWLVHRGHKPLFVHFFFPPTFLKNSEGNKKAEGDFSPNMDSTFGLFIVAL